MVNGKEFKEVKKKKQPGVTAPFGVVGETRFNIDGVGVTEEEYREAKAKAESDIEAENIKTAGQGREVRKKEDISKELEEKGAFEQVTPGRVDLSPVSDTIFRDTPLLGVATGALAAAGGAPGALAAAGGAPGGPSATVNIPGVGEFVDTTGQLETGSEAFPAPLTPETARESALREIRQSSFDEGISSSEQFGSFVEAIPGAGDILTKYAGNLIEDPSTNAENVLRHIKIFAEASSNGQEKVRNGLEDAGFALERARQMEEGISWLEGRLKLLITTSAVLRANSDQVNRIEEAITDVKVRVNRYRLAASFTLTREASGLGPPIPSEEALFFELRDKRQKEA